MKGYEDNLFQGEFTIDTSKMFLAGASAGAGAALMVAYLQKPAMINDIVPGISTYMGSIDADYYYASPSYPLPTVKGVMSMWGNFPMPGSISTPLQAANFFARNDYIAPFIAFQGRNDAVVDYNYRYEEFPSDEDDEPFEEYATTDFCLAYEGEFTVEHDEEDNDLLMIGPLTLRDLVLNAGQEAEVYLDCQMAHGLDMDCCPNNLTKKRDPNTNLCTVNCSYQSDFGTGAINQEATNIYMVQRTATFFSQS